MGITYQFTLDGEPIDFSTMNPEEKEKLLIHINDNAMRVLGYKRKSSENEKVEIGAK